MSLKEHISLLIEKAFTSRKAWVSQQSFPITRISLSTSTRIYTAPADGWFGAYSNKTNANSSLQMYASGSGGLSVRFTTNATASDEVSLSIPVSKGCNLVLVASVDPTEVWFSSTFGDS